MLRKILILLGIAAIALVVYFLAGVTAFSGAFDTKYSREELVKDFADHEPEYQDVVSFFEDQIPAKLQYWVLFQIGKRKRVTLVLSPFVIDPGNKILGGSDLKLDSPELKIALDTLGWNSDVLRELRSRLGRTFCDEINTAGPDNSLTEMSPYQNGWGSFTYRIFKQPISDSMTTITGMPLSQTRFGSRVVLSYSSAL